MTRLPSRPPACSPTTATPKGDALTVRLAGNAAHGTLTLQPNGSFSYTPAAGFTGTDTFTYAASDGTRESAVATVTIAVGDPALFSDSFSRATSPSVGNGWVEAEAAGAAAVLDGTRLSFADTSDAVMRPLVTHRFTEVASGYLEWEFELDWTKTGTDDAYAVHMQLGNGAQMNAELAYGWSRHRSRMGARRRRGSDARLSQGRGHDGADAAHRTGDDPRARRCRRPRVRRLRQWPERRIADPARDGRHVRHDAVLHGWRERGGVLGPDVRLRHRRSLAFRRRDSELGSHRSRSTSSGPTTRWRKSITLSYTDADGPGPHTFDIVDGPAHGTLGSDDGDATVVYTPTPGFIGTDSFTFRVGDGVANSGLATMSVVVQHYPGAAWETRTPAEVGLRTAALDALAASIGGVGSVVRNGYMVYTWGDQTAKDGLGFGGQARVAHVAVLRRSGESNRLRSMSASGIGCSPARAARCGPRTSRSRSRNS